LVDHLDPQLARILGLDLQGDLSVAAVLDRVRDELGDQELDVGTTSAAIRSLRPSIARRAALGAVGSRGMSKVTVPDMLERDATGCDEAGYNWYSACAGA
jgi:hypothetical protein